MHGWVMRIGPLGTENGPSLPMCDLQSHFVYLSHHIVCVVVLCLCIFSFILV